MPVAHDAVTELDRLLLDDPYGEAIEATMTVAGDLLQSRGELRGELIALEQAHAHALDPQTRRVQAVALDGWLNQHEASTFGSLGSLRHRKGAMRWDLRGGRLRALFLDVRRVVKPGAGFSVAELMQVVVSSPAARWLTDLRVRVRHEADAAEALAAILRAGRELPLELLIVSPTTRPLGHPTRGHAVELRKHFPHLWLVTRYARLAPLLDPELPDQSTAYALGEFAGEAMSQELRIRIGRGLSSGRKHTTKAACELIAGLGPSARVFAPTLELLLRPQVSHAAAWILPELPSFGPWAAELLPTLRRITGSTPRYSTETRCLAGRCVHALEGLSSPAGP